MIACHWTASKPRRSATSKISPPSAPSAEKYRKYFHGWNLFISPNWRQIGTSNFRLGLKTPALRIFTSLPCRQLRTGKSSLNGSAGCAVKLVCHDRKTDENTQFQRPRKILKRVQQFVHAILAICKCYSVGLVLPKRTSLVALY